MVRFVSNFKVVLHSFHKVQCHPGYFTCMLVAISDWKARHHHVRVTNCLNLDKHKEAFKKYKEIISVTLSDPLLELNETSNSQC